MSIVTINDFTLEKEVYIVNGRLCRIFTPPVVNKEHLKLYWIQYLDNGEIGAASEEEFIKLKNGKLFYE